jgi:hypothetical protein
MHPATDDHVRFAIEYPTPLKGVGVVLKDVPMHTAEVSPTRVKLGQRICAEFVVGAPYTIHFDLRAD